MSDARHVARTINWISPDGKWTMPMPADTKPGTNGLPLGWSIDGAEPKK